MGWVIGILLFAVASDQVSKALLYGKQLALIPGVIGVNSASELNTGMAWGLLGGKTGSVILLSVFTFITLGILTYAYIRYRKIMPGAIAAAMAMIAGGAIGNLIDRIALGGVRDFIEFQFVSFPIFNVADIFVTCGGVLLGVMLVLTKRGRGFAEKVFAEDDKKAKH